MPGLEAATLRTNPFGPDPTEELLAWALSAAGRHKDAQPYLAHWPMPRPQGESALVFGAFPRWVEIRATAFEREGNAAEAARLKEIWRKLTAG